MKKFVSLALTLFLVLSLLPTTALAAGAITDNADEQNYDRWSQPVQSYLYDNGNGLTRVEYYFYGYGGNGKGVIVEDYSADFALLSSRTVEFELSRFGGFYAGEDYNFLIFGQDNREEDDGKEVIRVVKYDKDWNRLGAASLFGANTVTIFSAGSLRCDEYGGYLYVRTCHEMYTTSDGLNHQANLTFSVRENVMEITDAFYDVMNTSLGYVSHSFNQFILVDSDGYIVTADHGDAYPRSHVLMRYSTKAGSDKFVPDGISKQTTAVDLVKFPGAIGANSTGSSLGGLAETKTGYVAAYNWNGEDAGGDRDIYLAHVDKDLKSVKTATVAVPGGASTPVLAPTGLEGGYLLWTSGENLSYAAYDAQGDLGETKTVPGRLSDCAPIPYGDGVVWYVTEDFAPAFYVLTADGLEVFHGGNFTVEDGVLTKYAGAASAGPIAYASTQSVLVDGKAVEFQCYALKDASGNDTNYIKLRDVASVLNGTAVQFNVGWDGAVNIETGKAYIPNGSEMSTPFSGNRSYEPAAAETRINGSAAGLNAITLKDDAGGAYTYYKLRDLGTALGFQVDWSAEKGIFIETK